MRRLASIFFLIPLVVLGQTDPKSKTSLQAKLTLKDDRIVISTQSARPLHQSIIALRSEFGWIVDYEDPIYLESELVDATDSKWRVEHPTDKGLMIAAGKDFSAEIMTKPPLPTASSSEIEGLLSDLLSQYRSTNNPGHFSIKDEGNTRFSIVGGANPQNASDLSGLFGVTVSLPDQNENVGKEIRAIFDAVSKQTGVKINFGIAPVNMLSQAHSSRSQENVIARQALSKILDSTGQPYVFDALYSASSNSYFVSISPAVQTYTGFDGTKIYLPVKLHISQQQ